MKQTLILLLVAMHSVLSAPAQVTPYTGGEGSGYAQNSSPQTICPLFFGDSADGHAQNNTPPVICPMFFGGNADGAAQNFSALTICPSFFGGVGDGSASDSIGCATILPIRLLDFNGLQEPLRNLLFWTTDFEPPIQQFDVERSSDGRNFSTIGTVRGSTNNNHRYTYIDNAPLPNINFYRLRIKEQNGEFSYSPVIVLKNFSVEQFSVYPNPAKDQLMIYCYVTEPLFTRIILYHPSGQEVIQKRLWLNKGGNYIVLDVQALTNGMYLLKNTLPSATMKILIQH